MAEEKKKAVAKIAQDVKKTSGKQPKEEQKARATKEESKSIKKTTKSVPNKEEIKEEFVLKPKRPLSTFIIFNTATVAKLKKD
jgi:hypothetical protein